MTYKVFGGTLSLTQSISHYLSALVWSAYFTFAKDVYVLARSRLSVCLLAASRNYYRSHFVKILAEPVSFNKEAYLICRRWSYCKCVKLIFYVRSKYRFFCSWKGNIRYVEIILL